MKKINSKLRSALLFSTLALGSLAANASLITYDVRSISNASYGDYRSGWSAQNTAISSRTPSDFNGLVGGGNSYNHLTINFDVSGLNAGSAIFQLAPDAGYGGALYLDGSLLSQNTADLWWEGNWAAAPELLIGNIANFSQGNHVLEAFWAEGCCNGGQGGRFNVNGGGWQALTVRNLDRLAVPEPGSLALLGLALAGLGFGRRKKA